ncbi:hypothetical protein C8F04DRAFT_1324566 [Mycena alexandri]|uniref:Uncharacterized protein n=1 Tax=Mycena alexandri TaxID=1745969 RepID=A0AAD6WLU4_9AGAR|nr:hypothetical protein C8F04DRAFT_1324566 [Mycena alexandri]
MDNSTEVDVALAIWVLKRLDPGVGVLPSALKSRSLEFGASSAVHPNTKLTFACAAAFGMGNPQRCITNSFKTELLRWISRQACASGHRRRGVVHHLGGAIFQRAGFEIHLPATMRKAVRQPARRGASHAVTDVGNVPSNHLYLLVSSATSPGDPSPPLVLYLSTFKRQTADRRLVSVSAPLPPRNSRTFAPLRPWIVGAGLTFFLGRRSALGRAENLLAQTTTRLTATTELSDLQAQDSKRQDGIPLPFGAARFMCDVPRTSIFITFGFRSGGQRGRCIRRHVDVECVMARGEKILLTDQEPLDDGLDLTHELYEFDANASSLRWRTRILWVPYPGLQASRSGLGSSAGNAHIGSGSRLHATWLARTHFKIKDVSTRKLDFSSYAITSSICGQLEPARNQLVRAARGNSHLLDTSSFKPSNFKLQLSCDLQRRALAVLGLSSDVRVWLVVPTLAAGLGNPEYRRVEAFGPRVLPLARSLAHRRFEVVTYDSSRRRRVQRLFILRWYHSPARKRLSELQ